METQRNVTHYEFLYREPARIIEYFDIENYNVVLCARFHKVIEVQKDIAYQ